jgi:hypothetical protein
LRGAFDFEPGLGDGVVQKLGHIAIRSRYQDERSLYKDERSLSVVNSKTPPLGCQGDFVARWRSLRT